MSYGNHMFVSHILVITGQLTLKFDRLKLTMPRMTPKRHLIEL